MRRPTDYHGPHLTLWQFRTLCRLRRDWATVGPPSYMLGEPSPGCVMVACSYSGGGGIWIGIETDGHAHS